MDARKFMRFTKESLTSPDVNRPEEFYVAINWEDCYREEGCEGVTFYFGDPRPLGSSLHFHLIESQPGCWRRPYRIDCDDTDPPDGSLSFSA